MGLFKAKIVLYPDWGQKVLTDQSKAGETGRYERYALRVAREIREASKSVFKVFEHKDNEYRTSNLSPPSYGRSWSVEYNRLTQIAKMANTDPGWYLVEWGAHPGGGNTRILRYKPLTRGLLIVSARWKV
jgi:hypothetical protein